MGATSMQRPKGLTDREFFARELRSEYEILATGGSRTSGEWSRVFYAAVKKPDGTVFAFVALIATPAGGWFTFKDMDETVGPNESDCPANVLDLLTPTDSEWANQWRARCRANLERKKARPKVTAGTRVRLANPLNYGPSYGLVTEFTYEDRNKAIAHAGDRNFRVRLPQGWRDREFEVVS